MASSSSGGVVFSVSTKAAASTSRGRCQEAPHVGGWSRPNAHRYALSAREPPLVPFLLMASPSH